MTTGSEPVLEVGQLTNGGRRGTLTEQLEAMSLDLEDRRRSEREA